MRAIAMPGVEGGRASRPPAAAAPAPSRAPLGPHPVTAAQRLRRACSWPSRSPRNTAAPVAHLCRAAELRGMSAVTSRAAMPPTMPSTRRRNGALAGITITMSDWIAAAIAKLACGREEPGDDERETQRQRELPPPRSRGEQQEFGDEDAHQHPEHGLENPARSRIADEPEARHAHGRGQQRSRMPEDVVREGVGAGRGDHDLQDRDRGPLHAPQRRVAGRCACASRWRRPSWSAPGSRPRRPHARLVDRGVAGGGCSRSPRPPAGR